MTLILIALGLIAGAWIVARFIARVITYAGTVCALPDAYGDQVELPKIEAPRSDHW